MPEPDDHPVQVDYAIDPDAMEEGIRRYLWPVTAQLTGVRVRYETARAEVKAAHDSEAPGWFGGAGHGDIRFASSSFLNAVEWQLRQLVQDQSELEVSLEEYQAMLEAHVKWARETDGNAANRFRAIGNDLDRLGY